MVTRVVFLWTRNYAGWTTFADLTTSLIFAGLISVVPPQVSHFTHMPFRTSVKLLYVLHISAS
jgi:hypothetical protein